MTAEPVDGVALPRAARTSRAFWSSRVGVAGAVVVATLILLSLLSPWISPHDPLAQGDDALAGPSASHWLGTDELGRDVLSRVLVGLRLSLLTALSTAVIAAVLGVAIGLCAGYFGGWVDGPLMRIMDVVLSVPATLLAVVLVAIMGGGVLPLIVAIAIVAVPPFARLTRASVLTVREREFVTAQRAAGASTPDIMLRTVLPNVLGPASVQFVVSASIAVLTESGLSFLGLGVALPQPSLGGMLATGNDNLYAAPWYSIAVGVVIALMVASFDALGVGLQRRFGGTNRGAVVA